MKMKARKTEKFDILLEKFYTKEEIINAKEKAKLRAKIMLSISDNVRKKMEKEQIGFNELVARIGTSPAQLNRVLNGNTNLTIDSLLKVCTALDLEPEIVFRNIS
jgi:DNA-binding Xre family transcriptional regulator